MKGRETREVMAATASSRPFRGTCLILLFLASYYIGNPFSRQSPTSESWFSWTPSSAYMDDPSSTNGTSLNDAHEGGPRVRQATMVYQTDKLNTAYERAIDSHLRHGEKWGVPTHILRHDIVEAGYFNKPAFLLGMLISEMAKPFGKRADWIVWFDADTICLNHAVPWALFLPPPGFEEIHFLGTKDQNGFNAGMFMIQVHEWSVKAMSEVIALRQLKPDVKFDFEDQGAIGWVLNRPGYEEHVLYQPHNWWNAFGLQQPPQPTDLFLLHFAGVDCCGQSDSKATVMSRWLDKLDVNPDEYYTPLRNMTLPGEIDAYWELLASAQKTLEVADAWQAESRYKGMDLQVTRGQLQKSIFREADDVSKLRTGVASLESLMADADSKPKDVS